jgi:hypothetical protein
MQFLAMFSMRVSVFLQWAWTYLTGSRGSRLIVNYLGVPSPNTVAVAQSDAAGSRAVPASDVSQNHFNEAGGNGGPVREAVTRH